MKTPPPSRERLLEAAIKCFGTHGYEGTSTRDLAKEAGVNIASISYYFKDKRGLYREVLKSLAETIQKALVEKTVELQKAVQAGELNDTTCRAALENLIRYATEFLLGAKIPLPLAKIFLREQMDPTADFEVLFNETMRPMHALIAQLSALLTGLAYPSEEASLCAHTLIGQISVYKTHKEAALRCLGWKSYTAEKLEKIQETVLLHTSFVIEGYRRREQAKR